MRKVIFTLSILCTVALLSAQTLVPAGVNMTSLNNKLQPYTPKQSLDAASNRGTNQVYIDYFNNEFDVATDEGGQPFFLPWPVNSAFDVSCSPVDSIDFNSFKWAGVRFDSIFDYVDGTVYDRSSLSSIKVDSITFYVAEHQNNSGMDDTLVFRIMETVPAALANRGLTFAVGTESTIINNVLWSDTLILEAVNGGLTTNLAGFTIPVDSAGVNGIHIPNPANGFIVMLDYYGPKEDTFFIADMNNFACGTSNAWPVESYVPENSLSFLNYGGYVLANGCNDISGVGDLSTSQLPAPCNIYYRQNIGIAVDITVDAPLSVNATTSSNTGCPNSTVTLNSNASGGSGSANYDIVWTGPAGSNFSTPYSPSTDVTLPNTNGPATFYVTVNDLVDNTSFTDSVTVNIRAVFVSLGNDTTIACSDSINISARVTGTTTGATFLWNDGAIGTTYLNAKPGRTYSVVATNSSGCTATDAIVINQPITQTVSFESQSYYYQNEDSVFVTIQPCATATVDFVNTSSNTTGWTWLWDFDALNPASPTNTLVNPRTVYPGSGVYVVTLVGDSAGCTVTADSLRLTVLPTTNALCNVIGINEADWLKNFVSIYPNPNTGSFVVDFSSINNEDVSITVFNLVGQTVYSHSGFSVNNTAIETVNMNQMGNGFYFVRVQVGNDAFTTKISVQK